jgi:ribose transport system substrate-binding protein
MGGAALAADDPVLAEAKANVVARAGPQNVWDGPTSSPKPMPAKHIAYLSSDQQNDASREWSDAVSEAAAKAGWQVTVIDGRGSPKSWIEGYNQAIALQVDGIVTDADVASMQEAVKAGKERGIVLVGIHGTAFPGPNEELSIFYNIQQDPRDIGKAQADWIIAHSEGKARVVVTTHCEYQIACTKAKATEDRIRECQGCEVLEVFNSPISEVAQRQPAAVTAWVQKYGTPLYITSVADYTADFQVPALRAGGVQHGEVLDDRLPGDRQLPGERRRAGGAVGGQPREHRAPRRVGERREDRSRVGESGHEKFVATASST